MNGAAVHPAPGQATGSGRGASVPRVSIVIKALNEEAKIARCIESALAALREIPGPSEIVLADSVSSDRTVQIARQYPITIVQFRHAQERGCGAGVQLGYQHSQGDFVFLLDGDMELLSGFLPAAMARLEAEPRLAGVAGLLEDQSIVNVFDKYRTVNRSANAARSMERWLNGGGLYRRAAIEAAGGYAADRNLKGWEEAELGMRLTTLGWKLERIDLPSTLHEGHSAGTWKVLRSLWRSRRAMAHGVLLKQAAGQRWLPNAIRLMLPPLLVICAWAGAVAAFAISLTTHRWEWIIGYGFAVAGLVLAFAVYKKSLKHALTSVGLWHFHAASLVLGLTKKVVPPTTPIASVVLQRKDPA